MVVVTLWWQYDGGSMAVDGGLLSGCENKNILGKGLDIFFGGGGGIESKVLNNFFL